MLESLITISIVTGTLLSIFLGSRNQINHLIILYTMYLYHLFFIVTFYFISLTRTSDAFNYYHRTLEVIENNSLLELSMGTKFIDNLTYLLINYFSFSYFNAFLLFGTIGFFGILLLYKIVFKHSIIHPHMALFFFLPGLHFWLASLGKDSTIFFFLVLSLWAIIKNKIFLMTFSIILVFLIRPHIALMLITSIGIYLMVKSQINLWIKIFSSIVLLSISVIVLQSVMQYVGIGNLDLATINAYIEQRQGYNLEGGSSIDISNMNVFVRFLTFWYRPLFESSNILYLLISFENLILIFMTLYIIVNRKYIIWNYAATVSVIYIILVSFILSSTIANFGIIIRQKMMIIPMFYYLFYMVVNNKSYNNIRRVSC
ncbi:MAG TPA: hypothetical protein EYG73_08630 [Arcobacter sp.]|nr:hypothetical protein [Arcobacter sp.]